MNGVDHVHPDVPLLEIESSSMTLVMKVADQGRQTRTLSWKHPLFFSFLRACGADIAFETKT